MRILNVVESAFRTLVEEQDDTILWLSQSLEKAGAELSVLLQGNACLYAFSTATLPPLAIGAWRQKTPANAGKDIQRLCEAGVPLYVIDEDVQARGLAHATALTGVRTIPRREVARLYSAADQVWRW